MSQSLNPHTLVAVGMALLGCLGAPGSACAAPGVQVDSDDALAKALRAAGPGTVLRLSPGTYRGGHRLEALAGTPANPMVIEAADPQDPPTFSGERGGASALHLSGSSHVHLRNLRVTGFSANGINADDAGNPAAPATGLRFEGLVIENTGPTGNHDALKLSGLADFLVRDCTFAGWGGSAIDMVGCHRGLIVACTFEGREGFSQDNGVQAKGGSSAIAVRDSFFNDAGQRAINLGGSTGLPYFRPVDAAWEARDIEVAGNRFAGSLSPVAWVGVDGGHVHHNTIFLPAKWVGRILQENTGPRFGRCRNGVFEHNLIVFDRRVQTIINVGGGTAPETFVIRNNAWFCTDQPDRGPGALPVPDSGGVTGVDPELTDTGTGTMTITSKNPRLEGIGAGAAGDP
ncbi:hypothetical protein BH23VER1_BH23VER1_32420 [soil metagenome]